MAQRGVRNPSSLTGTSGQGDLDSLRAAAPRNMPRHSRDEQREHPRSACAHLGSSCLCKHNQTDGRVGEEPANKYKQEVLRNTLWLQKLVTIHRSKQGLLSTPLWIWPISAAHITFPTINSHPKVRCLFSTGLRISAFPLPLKGRYQPSCLPLSPLFLILILVRGWCEGNLSHEVKGMISNSSGPTAQPFQGSNWENPGSGRSADPRFSEVIWS